MSEVGPTASSESPALERAGVLARSALLLSNPNPRVGCVLTDRYGAVIGEGFTQQAGGPHAEVMALRDARQRNADTTGCTAWVTLEPCSHHGRTPPCCDALVAAGVARIVVASLDPNPLVAGRGVARLRGAGVVVDVLPPEHPAARSCRELNIGFFSRMIRRRPWVRLKMAASLDGTSALANGASQWITGEAARADGHTWRARACAVLTGVGTVLADNPRLDVRHCATPRQPHLVIADSHWQTPPDAAVFGLPRTVRIVGTAACGTATEALAARGAQITRLPDDGTGRVDLAALMALMGQSETNELHVEAGPTLSGALLAAALVDELLVYLAPRLLGPGQPLVRLPGIERLEDGHRLRFEQIDRVGDDLRVLARFGAPDPFLSAVSAL